MKKSTTKLFVSVLIILSCVSYVYICHTESVLHDSYENQKIELKESSEKIVTNAKIFTLVADRFIKVLSSNY